MGMADGGLDGGGESGLEVADEGVVREETAESGGRDEDRRWRRGGSRIDLVSVDRH